MSSTESEGSFFNEKKESKTEIKNKIVDEFFVDESLNNDTVCKFCSKCPIDQELKNIFGLNVCRSCKKNIKFITKTTCKENYLLSDYDLKEFKHLTRPNPHKGTWSNMNLYLEDEIINCAKTKYENLENIEKIKEKREIDLMERKKKKLRKNIRDYKRKTILIKKNIKPKHEHQFVIENGIKKCKCGLEFEEEDI